jgi:large subunit ribosomal protein L18
LLFIFIAQHANGSQETGMLNLKTQARLKRKKRIRKKMVGTENRPRLCVFRSAKHIYAQVIDDSRGHTITAASSVEKTVRETPESKNKVTMANMVGKIIGRRALEKGIEKVVFDRNGFLYHGRVKAVSEGAREAGLKF